MKGFTTLLLSSLLGLSFAFAAPAPVVVNDLEERAATVSVTVPAGSIIGSVKLGVESFSGIPFGLAPVGSLRLKPPVRVTAAVNNFDGTKPAPACPQFISDTDSTGFLDQVMNTISPLITKVLDISEDCLSITVARPAGTKAGDNLPVLYWIFGGGFEVS
jgi:carboxylesterase type B